jgi:hypothetical protein
LKDGYILKPGETGIERIQTDFFFAAKARRCEENEWMDWCGCLWMKCCREAWHFSLVEWFGYGEMGILVKGEFIVRK